MERTTSEKQIEDLNNAVTRYGELTEKMDTIIDYAQRQRMTLVEQRAQLSILRDMLMPHPATKEIGTIIGIGAGIGYFVEKILEVANEKYDKDNARIDRELKEQKERIEQSHTSGH